MVAPAPLTTLRDGRGNRLSMSEVAFRGNVAAARARAASGARLLQVVKGHGYGLGLNRMVKWGLASEVDGFCAGTPEEALSIRRLAPRHSVLLFTGSGPDELPRLLRAGVTVTINSVEASAAVVAANVEAEVFLELDCGFGRFGLDETALDSVLDAQRRHGATRIAGIYTHLGQGGAAILDRGLAMFDRAVAHVHARLPTPLLTMVASTHVLLERPGLAYRAIDPGRLLYGIVDCATETGVNPVLAEVQSRIIQVNQIEARQTVRIGYGEDVSLPKGGTTGVFPLGWRDGLSPRSPFGVVLVRGRRVPVIARTLLHSVVDLSSIDDPVIGDEVVLIGRQAAARLSIAEAAAAQGISATELHFTLADAIVRAASETQQAQ